MAKITDPDSLTWLVDGSPVAQNVRVNTTAKTITLVAGGSLVAQDGATGQALYSLMKDIWKADSTAIKFPFPMESITDEQFELISGWDWGDDTTRKMVRDAGWAVRNTSGVLTQQWAGMITLGAISSGSTAYYVQSSSSSATATNFTYTPTTGINEAVRIYLDANGDGTPDEDYRTYFKAFLREQAYTYADASNSDIGATTLTYKAYRFPLTHATDLKVTHDDTTVNGYGISITWYAAAQSRTLGSNPYDFHVIVDGNNKTGVEVYEGVQRLLRQATDIDSGAGTRTGKIAAQLLRYVGDTLYTLYQTGVGGVFIDNLAASSWNSTYFADDTQANRAYPFTASLRLNFNENLQNDTAAKYWVYFTTLPGAGNDFGESGAVLVDDFSGTDMTGTVSAASYIEHTFDYDGNVQGGRTAATDAAVTVVAIGESTAQYVKATGTITRSTANVVSLVSNLERNYIV